MKKSTLTEDKAEKTPTGGVLVGKRQGQTIIHNKGTLSGYLVGKTHAEGGIKAVNKSTGQPLEMQGGEVVITAPAVSDTTKSEFNGKMMTNREILSEINVKGGGVAFAEKGMEIPKNIKRTGASYNYGGKTMTDHEIYKYITGGGIAEDFSIRDIANIHQVPLSELKEEVRIGMIAESEHKADKKEQMEIVKDHLLENPKYYTLLKKAGLVEEDTAPLEKSKWLKQFYVTNNPSIDKLLKDLQPKIQELIEKQKELVIKESTKTFGEPRPMTELDIQFYEAGLIFKMVQAFNKYLKNTDELYDVSINKRGSLFEVNGKVKRDGRTYKFDTELIDAGGYNIQEYHYRYIIKTDLPSSNENSAVENIKSKMGVLKKIRTIDEDIERYANRVSLYQKELIQGFTEYKIQGVQHKKDLTDYDIKFRQRDIKDFQKEIEKLEGKKSDLLSVFSSLEKKGVGVNFGKQVKEAIGRKILDRLRGSKYKETGDTLDFKIESRIIKGKDLDNNRFESLGTINTFSFTDEGNGLCTMKAGLELRGKYTLYAEYKNLPINEIPYKINEIFNGEFSKYLQYDDGGELYSSENDYVKYLLDRNLETDLAEIKLKNYLQSKNIQSGMPLPDSIRKDEEYQKLKRDFDSEFSKMQKKPIHKNSRYLDRVQRQKDLRRYKEILDDVINQKFKNGGEVEKALFELEKAPSVKFWYEPDFNSESHHYSNEGKPNSFVTLNENNNSKVIIVYDEKGKLVGVFKISTGGDSKGAFKIVVREDAKNKGWGKKLLDKAEKENIDIVSNIKNNSFSHSGRNLLRSWLNSKSKKFKKGGQVESLVKDAKSGNTPARDLNNYNDMLDVEADGQVGGDTGLFANGGIMANGGLIAPNGKPSNLTPEQYKLVRTLEFKAWFGDWENDPENSSKVVDENGEPMVVYHFSDIDFNVFEIKGLSDGFFFTKNIEDEEFSQKGWLKSQGLTYEQAKEKGYDLRYEKEKPYFLNIKQFFTKSNVKKSNWSTPYFENSVIEFAKRNKKNDGVEFLREIDNKQIIVAFEPNQIKLADGTNTTFDANNPDIRFDDGGSVGTETVLFAVRKGEPDYNEVLITNNPDRIEDAKKWALANGFDRLRVSTIDMREKPDFRKTFEGGGYMENGGYLDALSEKSKKTIDSNYNREFGIYDFDFNKESKRENYFEWFTKFKNEQFKKNLKKGIKAISEDIDLLEKRKQSDKKLKDFEELILPTLGNDVKNPSLSEYQEMVFMNPYATEEELRKALSDTSIFNEDGSINKAKITESEFFNEEGINLPSFERFAEKNPEYKGVFDSWKKMLDENMALHNKETNAFRYPSIADLKELKEELSNLDKTNYATGGSIKPYDANMEGDSADMMFDEGGAVGSVVKNWNEVPSIWKDTTKVKKVAWTNSPYDKGLYTIVAPFLGKDELRPIFGGINFDENGITVTNTYTLITLPYPSKKFEGVYESDLSKKPNQEQITIDGKYPNYSAIIPKQEVTKPFFINVYKLLQYNNVAMKFASKYTNAVNYKIEDEIVGFNAKFLNENLKTLLKLGHETAYAHYMSPKNALLLSPNKDYEIGNDEIILTMPVMIQNKSYGAVDIDYGKELYVYYDFNDNEIHNADGSVAEFKMTYASNSVISKEDVNLLEKLANGKNILQILNYVKVKDSIARASDLESEYYLSGVDLPDGIYKPNKGALEITMEAIEDFPSKPQLVLDDQSLEFTIDSDVLEYYVDKFKNVVGKDELRPVMQGICLHHTSDNKLFLAGTDANILLKINITEYVSMPEVFKDMKFIIQPKRLYDFLNSTEHTNLRIKCNSVATTIDSDKWSFYARNIDGNYPNYDAVIPTETTKLVRVAIEPIKKAFNSESIKNYVKEVDKSKDVFVFNKEQEIFIANSGKRFGSNDYDVNNIQKICETNVNFTIQDYYNYNKNVLLIMPYGYDKQTNFSFRKDLLERVFKIINSNTLDLHYTEMNRAYLIPIDTFDFKGTTKEHKVKEQKPSVAEIKLVSTINEVNEIKEAIETLEMLLETATRKDKKEIKEAIEVLQMLLDTYEY